MLTFALENIEDFETEQKVNKLIRNGKCVVDQFISDIKKDKNLSPELGDLFAIIEDVANNQILPSNKYRRLHVSKKVHFTPYEAKSKHLRVYLFHENTSGQIIVIGGKKTEQKEDLKRLEKILSEYYQFLQQ